MTEYINVKVNISEGQKKNFNMLLKQIAQR